MKNILITIILIVSTSCTAQQIYPLNTDFDEVPQNSYLKDLNNELDPYIGTYRTNFQGNEITIFIIKENMKFIRALQVYQDILSIRYIIKNSNGIILQDTQNMNFESNQIRYTIYSLRTNPILNTVSFSYGGINCGVGNGLIYLKRINSNQLSWEYRPDDIIIDNNRCPVGTDINIYLPKGNLIFTKL